MSLIAACDLDQKRLESFSEKFSGNTYTNYHEMIGKEDLNVVVLCAPSGMHFHHARDLLKKGIKDKILFDRGSYLYHGRVKELAMGVRSKGIKF